MYPSKKQNWSGELCPGGEVDRLSLKPFPFDQARFVYKRAFRLIRFRFLFFIFPPSTRQRQQASISLYYLRHHLTLLTSFFSLLLSSFFFSLHFPLILSISFRTPPLNCLSPHYPHHITPKNGKDIQRYTSRTQHSPRQECQLS